jgi:hypothetical protein
MPPKKKHEKELPVEGSSHAAREQVTTTTQTSTQITHIPQTFHLQLSASLHTTPTDQTEQPPTQAEVLALNTSNPNTMPPPPPTPQSQESFHQDTNFPTFGTNHMITGGSNLNFENKRQKREHYRQVNRVAVEGPIMRTKWSHVQITFTESDIKLTSFPHTDAMVITSHIDKWDVTMALVDNRSQIEILFLSTFEQIGFSKKQLNEASKPLYDFRGRRFEPVGSISLPVSFSSLSNARTKCIIFDVVDMSYPYNAIFRRGLLNTFEAALHSLYLYLKVPAAMGVIIIHGSQKDARNVEQGFILGHMNVNCLQDDKAENGSKTAKRMNEGTFTDRPIEPECETKKVLLEPRVADKVVMISQDLSSNVEVELLSFLDRNSDVFIWQTSDLMGVSRDIIEHKLQVNPTVRPKKQKLRKMSDEKVAAAKAEMQRLLDAGFIHEVLYPSWLANEVRVKKKMASGECA